MGVADILGKPLPKLLDVLASAPVVKLATYAGYALAGFVCVDVTVAALLNSFFGMILYSFKSTNSRDYSPEYAAQEANQPVLKWYYKHVAPQLTADILVQDSALNHMVNKVMTNVKDKIFCEFGTCRAGGFNHIIKGQFKLSVLFDSFSGFIEEWAGFSKDDINLQGQLPKLLYSNVMVAKGWFHETIDTYLDALKIDHIDLLHIDPDAYAPSKTVLDTVLKRKLIDESTVIVFDELFDVHGPGGTLRYSNIIGEECKALMEVCDDYNLVPKMLYYGRGVEYVISDFPFNRGVLSYTVLSKYTVYAWWNYCFLPRTIKGAALVLKPK